MNRSERLPKNARAEILDRSINRDHTKIMLERLSRNQPVEWICMRPSKCSGSGRSSGVH